MQRGLSWDSNFPRHLEDISTIPCLERLGQIRASTWARQQRAGLIQHAGVQCTIKTKDTPSEISSKVLKAQRQNVRKTEATAPSPARAQGGDWASQQGRGDRTLRNRKT